MKKILLSVALIFLFFKMSLAQTAKHDTDIYYFNYNGLPPATMDTLISYMLVLKPDTIIDKNLFVIKAFYPNRQLSYITGSKSRYTDRLMYEGSYISYYNNGHKRRITKYKDGVLNGDIINYYPNGKLYSIQLFDGHRFLLNECRDSLGNVLAEEGNGRWVSYLNGYFDKNQIRGSVENGLQEGEWIGMAFRLPLKRVYKGGKLTTVLYTIDPNTYGKNSNNTNPKKIVVSSFDKIFSEVDLAPEFPGGMEKFYQFVAYNIKYPQKAKKSGTSGKVIITFVVEKDGSLSNIKVAKDIGNGCGEEAVRVMQLVPKWKPGIQGGEPVRVAFSVPVSFN